MALFTDKWIRVFDVPEISKHIKGYTLYKIISIVYPKSCPDAVTKVTVWKRYNDFKKLHRELKLRHKFMHITDKFPNLASSSYFKRFDSEVINQRKNSILLFLEYIALHPPLFKSVEFVKFFETSQTPQESLNSNISIIRAQLNLPNDPEIVLPYESDDDQAHSDSDSVSTFSSTSVSFAQIDETNSEGKSFAAHSNLARKISATNSVLHSSKMVSSDTFSVKSSKSVTFEGLNLYPTPPATPDCVNTDSCNPVQYLTNAAELITKATEYELEENYNEAFTAYKNGISCLLEGVKDDREPNRRQMIRHKIEKYLLRAEKIYNLHLSPEITQIKNICKSKSEDVIYNSKRTLEDLYSYKVLKVIENGMVVLHKSEHNIFYMKTLQKGAHIYESESVNIPSDVPYMVKLFQYYDTVNALFLVTQYVNGEKLFDYVKQKYVCSDIEPATKYSCVTFEKEVLDSLDKDGENAASDSSEYSYSELINDYKSKKCLQTNNDKESDMVSNCVDDTPHGSINSLEMKNDQNDSSENENGSIKSSALENLVKHTEDLVSSVNNNLEEIQTQSIKATNDIPQKYALPTDYHRSISESSFTEEFSTVNYIPPIEDIIKWAAQLLLAIDKLHRSGIVIVDLNPSKLLIDDKGNLILTFITNFQDKQKLFSSKYEGSYYFAPEIFGLHPVTYAADWWSYGSILFELLTGMPLQLVHPEGIWSYTVLKIPKYISAEGKSLLRQLLKHEPNERLGCGIHGIEDLKSHPFFHTVDWNNLYIKAFDV